MSDEKLCGFWRKDAGGMAYVYTIGEDKLIPVRLFSESVSFEEYKKTTEHLQKQIRYWVDLEEKRGKSVSLEWLERFVKDNEYKQNGGGIWFKKSIGDLLLVARKQAVDKKG